MSGRTCFNFRKLETLLLVSELREVYFSFRIYNDRDTSLSICSVVIKTMVVDVLHTIFLLYFSFIIQNASDTSFYFYFIESNIVHGRSMYSRSLVGLQCCFLVELCCIYGGD